MSTLGCIIVAIAAIWTIEIAVFLVAYATDLQRQVADPHRHRKARSCDAQRRKVSRQ